MLRRGVSLYSNWPMRVILSRAATKGSLSIQGIRVFRSCRGAAFHSNVPSSRAAFPGTDAAGRSRCDIVARWPHFTTCGEFGLRVSQAPSLPLQVTENQHDSDPTEVTKCYAVF